MGAHSTMTWTGIPAIGDGIANDEIPYTERTQHIAWLHLAQWEENIRMENNIRLGNLIGSLCASSSNGEKSRGLI
jgi:hypothetical protein